MADGYRSERLLHNPLQAQRDYFGAHTYERFDEEGTFRSEWLRLRRGAQGGLGLMDLDAPVQRFDGNPILTCHDVNAVWKSPDLQVRTVHNAGIAEHGGESLMLFRSHLRDGISVLGLARSADGLHDWRVDP